MTFANDPADVLDCRYTNRARVKIIVVTCNEGSDAVIDSGIRLNAEATSDVAAESIDVVSTQQSH